MKILVVSLLRLGDIVMTTPVLRILKNRGDTVHLLINKQFASIEPLLADVDRFIYLNREDIATSLVEPDHNLFEGYDRLKSLADNLSSEGYDLVINLTHNRLSGRLVSLIVGPDILGLQLPPVGPASFGSPWFRYLNELGDYKHPTQFHYCDIFQYAIGEKIGQGQLYLYETANGKNEWSKKLSGLGPVILIQPFSHEQKKQWSVANLLRFISQLEDRFKTKKIVIMGAPFEADALFDLQQRLNGMGSQAQTMTLSLEAAFSAVKNAQLFVTVDTAIKHFAAATRTPTLEIALGSSDPFRTGIYRDNAYILRSRIDCAPCSHSSGCHQPRHLCEESLDFEHLASLCLKITSPDTKHSDFLSQSPNYEILKTWLSPQGFWTARPTRNKCETFEHHLNRSAWRLSLSLPIEEMWQEMGTESLRFVESLSQAEVESFSENDVKALEVRLERRMDRVRSLKTSFQHQLQPDHNRSHLIKELKNLLHECNLNHHHPLTADGQTLTALRQMQVAMSDIEQKSAIQLKLVRHLLPLQKEST